MTFQHRACAFLRKLDSGPLGQLHLPRVLDCPECRQIHTELDDDPLRARRSSFLSLTFSFFFFFPSLPKVLPPICLV